MKYFKHIAGASDDEFIADIEERFGLEGYARWWKMLEAIARQMKKGSHASATYPIAKWCSFLKAKPNKLTSFLVHCRNQRKINFERTENALTVEVPNLLKYLDEYSARQEQKSGQESGQTPEPSRVKSESVSESLFPGVEKLSPKKEDRERDSSAGGGKKKRELTEQQQRVKFVEDAAAEYGGCPGLAPPLIARWIGEFGSPEEIIAAIHDIGPPGHVAKGPAYLYRTLERRRDERDGKTSGTDGRRAHGKTAGRPGETRRDWGAEFPFPDAEPAGDVPDDRSGDVSQVRKAGT